MNKMRLLSACGALLLASSLSPAFAQDAKIAAAVATFKATAADPAKVATYCEMSNAMATTGDQPDPKAEAKADELLKKLGPDFATAWNAGENLAENSPDAKALTAAMDELDSKCPTPQ